MMADRKLNEAFPTIDNVVEQEDALSNDRFDELARTVAHNSDLIVFSGEGDLLYATSDEAAEKITASDLPTIAGSSEDRLSYEVLVRKNDQGETEYEILQCKQDEDSLAKTVKASAICTEDGTILEGTLFAGRTSLTERELSLIKGTFGNHKTIQKHEYETNDGLARTAVLISPVVSESAYDAIVAEAKTVWYWAIPLAVAATIVAVAALAFIVRRGVRPLDQAINAKRHSETAQTGERQIPIELRDTYDNFTDLMSELDNAQQEKQQIIANVSHDLKTPLTVIRGYTQAFEDGQVPPEKQGEYLHAINERAQAATKLIEELFAYAKSEHPSFKPALADWDVHEQLRQLVARHQPDIERAGDQMEIDIPDGPLIAKLDWGLVERAVDNLITNARKHNPAGTLIKVACEHDDSSISLYVADTGAGMPAEMQETAFEPFVTSNASRSSGGGTGLGLSIVRSCARVHGGTARFASPEEPYRTEIVIVIPRS